MSEARSARAGLMMSGMGHQFLAFDQGTSIRRA
jgi:hypothetical protein